MVVGALVGIGVAWAADGTPQAPASIDVINELWAMAKAAGILGAVVLGYLLRREIQRGDRDRAELSRMQEERDSMHERSLTALVSLEKTMADHARITTELISSNRAFVDWLKERY